MEFNENTQAAETVESEIDEVTTDADFDSFDEEWDNDSYVMDTAEYETETAEQEESESNEEPAENQTEDKPDEKVDENPSEKLDTKFQVKYMHSTKEFDWGKDREEIIANIQKGMAFDLTKGKLTNKISEYEEFLNELTDGTGMSIEQLMDSTRAKIYQNKERQAGREVSDTDALLKVQAERASKAKSKEELERTEAKAREEAEKKQRKEVFDRFMKAYPDVSGDKIPDEVWQKVNSGMDLTAAYSMYENKMLKTQIETLKLNKKNQDRSTGSAKTAGSRKQRDDFDAGWDDAF